MTATFDALRKRPAGRPRGTCPRCGAHATDGAVRVEVRERGDDGGPAANGKTVATKAKSFCEACCVLVYEQIIEAMEATR